MPDTILSRLFPPSVATACMPVSDAVSELYPQELKIIAKAVEKRRREFMAGRCCARKALGKLGIADTPIPHDVDCAPVWPAGCIGAISHSHTWAGAAVARSSAIAGIGLDIETVERVTMSIGRKVLTAAEAAIMESLPEAERKQFLALTFSIKESVYKCLAPLVSLPLNFPDAELRVLDSTCVEVHMDRRITGLLPACEIMTGRYFLHEGCVFTGITI